MVSRIFISIVIVSRSTKLLRYLKILLHGFQIVFEAMVTIHLIFFYIKQLGVFMFTGF